MKRGRAQPNQEAVALSPRLRYYLTKKRITHKANGKRFAADADANGTGGICIGPGGAVLSAMSHESLMARSIPEMRNYVSSLLQSDMQRFGQVEKADEAARRAVDASKRAMRNAASGIVLVARQQSGRTDEYARRITNVKLTTDQYQELDSAVANVFASRGPCRSSARDDEPARRSRHAGHAHRTRGDGGRHEAQGGGAHERTEATTESGDAGVVCSANRRVGLSATGVSELGATVRRVGEDALRRDEEEAKKRSSRGAGAGDDAEPLPPPPSSVAPTQAAANNNKQECKRDKRTAKQRAKHVSEGTRMCTRILTARRRP